MTMMSTQPHPEAGLTEEQEEDLPSPRDSFEDFEYEPTIVRGLE